MKNKILIESDEISLIFIKGIAIKVDTDNLDLIRQYSWHIKKSKDSKDYVRASFTENGKTKRITLHRLIMNAKSDEMIDHIDGNTMNNMKCNLRKCNKNQNMWNRQKHKTAQSIFKGVRITEYGTYRARISYNNKRMELGTFKTESEAAKAYDKKAKELFGEFARLNFPQKTKTEIK